MHTAGIIKVKISIWFSKFTFSFHQIAFQPLLTYIYIYIYIYIHTHTHTRSKVIRKVLSLTIKDEHSWTFFYGNTLPLLTKLEKFELFFLVL